MRPGEIFLAQFPFGDVAGMKLRPVVLVTGPMGSIPEVLVAYISSVIPAQPLPSDLLLDPGEPEFRSTNLKTISALRLLKLATIHSSSLA
jgi:mRNA interferase MazF